MATLEIVTRTQALHCDGGCCHVTEHETMTSLIGGVPSSTVSECAECGYVLALEV